MSTSIARSDSRWDTPQSVLIEADVRKRQAVADTTGHEPAVGSSEADHCDRKVVAGCCPVAARLIVTMSTVADGHMPSLQTEDGAAFPPAIQARTDNDPYGAGLTVAVFIKPQSSSLMSW